MLAESGALLPARYQMAFTLGVHILLVPFGVVLPLMILIAHRRGLKRDDPDAMLLARRWSKVMALLFAVGAVTGTVLSFEMGLLWPGLMGRFGDVFGLPFVMEGVFFFLEAILIAIYVYGWDRLGPRVHFWLATPLPVVAVLGSVSILAANSWMNTPGGFTLDANGNVTDVEVAEALFTPALWYEALHFIFAALIVAGFSVAAVYAVGMLRGRRDAYHRLGFLIPFTIATIATPLQMVIGDQVMRGVIRDQPVKFAALELVPETATDVPEVIFGRIEDGKVKGGIAIPGLASFLTGFSTDTEIQGLNTVPPEDQPPATIVHWAFDVMIGAALFLTAVVAWFAFVWWRRREIPKSRWFLRAAAVSALAAMAAMESGWIATEVGRQPWVVYNVLRTSDAVTDAEGVWVSFSVIVVLYAVLAVVTVSLLRRMARRWREGPSGPSERDTQGPSGPSERDTQGPSGPSERDTQPPSRGGPYDSAGPLELPAPADGQ